MAGSDKLKVSLFGFDQTFRIRLEIPRIQCSPHLLYFPPTTLEGKVHTYAKILQNQDKTTRESGGTSEPPAKMRLLLAAGWALIPRFPH